MPFPTMSDLTNLFSSDSSSDGPQTVTTTDGSFELRQDFEQRLTAFKSDCDNGSVIACHSLAEFTSVVMEDFEGAYAIFNKGCYVEREMKESVASGKSLGQGTVRGTDPKDGKSSAILYPPSCFNLGRHYLIGKGVKRDDVQAYDAFNRGCTVGNHLPSCHHLSIMLLDDTQEEKKTVKKLKADINRAAVLLEESCVEGGDQESCYMVGGLFLKGKSSTPPAAVAPAVAPIVAADGSTAPAPLISIPPKPFNDDLLKKDALRASKFYDVACKSGHAPSCFNLAVMFKHGDVGIPADEKKFEKYKGMTETLVQQGGGLGGGPKKG
jgi:TPR repeat protein